jgi:DNA-binding NtrC family response regulator
MQFPKKWREVLVTAYNSSILCVDDESLPLLLRKLVLEKQGYHVITASSATDAMQALKDHSVDLVLTDQLMPGGTGTELAQSIKREWPRIPVILMSGVNEIPPDISYADVFISKTEGPVAMCEKISAVLEAQGEPLKQGEPLE